MVGCCPECKYYFSVMGMMRYVYCAEDDTTASYSAILLATGVEIVTCDKEKKVYRACLTRVVLSQKPGRFTFEEQDLDFPQSVYEQLKDRYEANKTRALQTFQTNID
ncbi:MAG: hypothetical protein AB7F19_06625 [Candidatus Babeliales bacterium]